MLGHHRLDALLGDLGQEQLSRVRARFDEGLPRCVVERPTCIGRVDGMFAEGVREGRYLPLETGVKPPPGSWMPSSMALYSAVGGFMAEKTV